MVPIKISKPKSDIVIAKHAKYLVGDLLVSEKYIQVIKLKYKVSKIMIQ